MASIRNKRHGYQLDGDSNVPVCIINDLLLRHGWHVAASSRGLG